MPARTISAMYAPSLIARPINAAWNAPAEPLLLP
jgi:hypothetical protein